MAKWLKTDPIRDRSAEEDVRSGTGRETQHYRVFFDGPDAYAANAVYSPGIPAPDERLGTTNLYVSNRSSRQDDNDPSVWIVEIVYSTYPDQQQKPKEPRPEGAKKWNIDLSATSVAYQEDVHQDRDGKAILNVNDEPVAQTRTETDEQINVSFHTHKPDFEAIDLCLGKCNDAPITLTLTTYKVVTPGDEETPDTVEWQTTTRTFAPETLKLDARSWNLVYDDGDKVTKINLVFLYKKDTWASKIPNLSYFKQGPNGETDEKGRKKLFPITERDIGGTTDNPVNAPQYLDANGKIIPPGSPIVTFTANMVPVTSFSTLLEEIV
ncbi:MAG: hypothetical protein FWD61_03325 [Phycisphaerales bacterium]|nr:hypothetical protein [Phycisphaerales bacterium]